MGGSIRKDMSAKVTHLIANVSGGEKYQYAATFRVPIMHLEWVLASWECRDDIEFGATMDTFLVSPFNIICFKRKKREHFTKASLFINSFSCLS